MAGVQSTLDAWKSRAPAPPRSFQLVLGNDGEAWIAILTDRMETIGKGRARAIDEAVQRAVTDSPLKLAREL